MGAIGVLVRGIAGRFAMGVLGGVGLVVVAGAESASAAEQSLQPHRAVYDVALADVAPAAGLVEATGRLVFELSGGACEGHVVNSRFVTRVVDREGESRVTDLRSATFETSDPARFDFMNQTYADNRRTSHVKGTAEARADGLHVERTQPKKSTATLGRAVFPTAHTALILQAAEAGDKLLEVPVFDGGEEGDSVYDTTTVIGPARTGLPGASDAERAALTGAIENADALKAYRLVISYFEEDGAGGESTPAYELTFALLENGIAYDVTFAYTTFSLAGSLANLELDALPDC